MNALLPNILLPNILLPNILLPDIFCPVEDQESGGIDRRGRHRGGALAVARPGSPRDIAEVARLSDRVGMAVVCQGGNRSCSGLAFPGAEIRTLSGDVTPTLADLASISGIQTFAANLAGLALTTCTGVMVGITNGSFVIPLAAAGCLSLVGAAACLFLVGEIAPLKPKGDDEEGGEPAPALATGRA